MQLDEQTLRKPTFTEGARVRLADGQLWTFPKPTVMFYPFRQPDGSIAVAWRLGHGIDHAEALERHEDLAGDDFQATRIGIRLELAAKLLLRNYDLDNRALRRLITLDETTDPELWPDLINVLYAAETTPAPVEQTPE